MSTSDKTMIQSYEEMLVSLEHTNRGKPELIEAQAELIKAINNLILN